MEMWFVTRRKIDSLLGLERKKEKNRFSRMCVGPSGALQRSTLRRKVNREEHDQVPDQLMRWV
jgi:hypothetical protein